MNRVWRLGFVLGSIVLVLTMIVWKAWVPMTRARGSVPRMTRGEIAGRQARELPAAVPVSSPTNPKAASSEPGRTAPKARTIPMLDEEFLRNHASLIKEYATTYHTALVKAADHFGMDPQSVRSISKVLAVTRASQLLYEAEIAEVKSASYSHASLEIPSYSDESLLDYARNGIGQINAAFAASSDFDAFIAANFDGLGTYAKFIEIDRASSPDANRGLITVTQTLTNRADGRAIATTQSTMTLHRLGGYSVLVASFLR